MGGGEIIMAVFLFVLPFFFHMGLLTAASLYPERRSGTYLLDLIVFRLIVTLFIINGVLLSSAHVLKSMGHPSAALWVIVLGLPTFVAQLVAAV